MQNSKIKVKINEPVYGESNRGFECWEFEDVEILVSFPDKNLLISTNKQTVLGAFLKEFNNNLEYQNKIKKIAGIKPIPYFVSLAITTIFAISFLIIIYYAYSKNVILFDPYISLFGFFASIGLSLTSIVGILNWNKNS